MWVSMCVQTYTQWWRFYISKLSRSWKTFYLLNFSSFSWLEHTHTLTLSLSLSLSLSHTHTHICMHECAHMHARMHAHTHTHTHTHTYTHTHTHTLTHTHTHTHTLTHTRTHTHAHTHTHTHLCWNTHIICAIFLTWQPNEDFVRRSFQQSTAIRTSCFHQRQLIRTFCFVPSPKGTVWHKRWPCDAALWWRVISKVAGKGEAWAVERRSRVGSATLLQAVVAVHGFTGLVWVFAEAWLSQKATLIHLRSHDRTTETDRC